MVIRVLLHPSTIRNKERDVVKDVKYELLYLLINLFLFKSNFLNFFSVCKDSLHDCLNAFPQQYIDLKNKRIVVTMQHAMSFVGVFADQA